GTDDPVITDVCHASMRIISCNCDFCRENVSRKGSRQQRRQNSLSQLKTKQEQEGPALCRL
ncbi:hypothetical protein GOODEAATRI_034322, partial [Goodea atripinnis]